MKVQLNREAKYFCKAFPEIREKLLELNARYVSKKQQHDYIYKIYDPATKLNSKRIKIRVEDETSCIAYVYSRGDDQVNIEFDYYKIEDKQIISILNSVHGPALHIRKTREVWSKGSIVFHLDTIEGIGNIFEIELLETASTDAEDIGFYKACFEPFVLEKIDGLSNEDLMGERGQKDGTD